MMKEVRVSVMTTHGLVKLCQPTQPVVFSFVSKLNNATQERDAGSCKYELCCNQVHTHDMAVAFTLQTGTRPSNQRPTFERLALVRTSCSEPLAQNCSTNTSELKVCGQGNRAWSLQQRTAAQHTTCLRQCLTIWVNTCMAEPYCVHSSNRLLVATACK